LALVPEGIAEAKNVVSHQNLEACDNGHMGDTSAEGRRSEEVGNDFQGMVCVDVGIHRHSVAGEQGDVREVDVESAQSSLEVEGTLDVRGELTDERLELLVKPASESVSDTPTYRDDRSHSPWGLVDLRHNVEVGEFVGDVKRAAEVSLIGIADVLRVLKEKRLNESHSLVNFSFGVFSGQRDVSRCVGEVGESASYILGSLDDAGA
jgi:hypothetical protein